uniref:Uncharacterized protein n=1 Tax=Arundo donax TaxID=35708 RepID=A0A0A9ERB8_ARUDO
MLLCIISASWRAFFDSEDSC